MMRMNKSKNKSRKDYKKSKKMGYSDAARALEAVNEKIKAQRRR
jgi:hypothetical protein